MRLSIPFLMANHNNHTWTNQSSSSSGLFQPSHKFKSMFPLPINTSSNDNMSLLQKPEIEIVDEKDCDTKENNQGEDGALLSPNCSPDDNKPDEQDSTSEIDIKPELTDFLHPASHRHLQTTTESNRSYSPSHDDHIAETDDFAQDLRITSSRNLDCGSSYEHHHALLQGGSLDSKDSSPNFKRFARFNSGLHVREEPDRDDCDFIGSNVTIKLRTMDKTQRIIAEKLISEVLFYGQFSELDKTAKVIPKES